MKRYINVILLLLLQVLSALTDIWGMSGLNAEVTDFRNNFMQLLE